MTTTEPKEIAWYTSAVSTLFTFEDGTVVKWGWDMGISKTGTDRESLLLVKIPAGYKPFVAKTFEDLESDECKMHPHNNGVVVLTARDITDLICDKGVLVA